MVNYYIRKELRGFGASLSQLAEDHERLEGITRRVASTLRAHLDNAAGDSSWVKEALEILEGKS